MGFPLYVTCCFSLAAFNILSLCLMFLVWLVYVLVYFSLGLSWMGLFVPLGLDGLFPFPCGKNVNDNLFKIFFLFFLFLFFWGPFNSNVGAFNISPDVSETILSSFHSFYFILLFRNYFHHCIFQLTDLFCFRYSAIDSF